MVVLQQSEPKRCVVRHIDAIPIYKPAVPFLAVGQRYLVTSSGAITQESQYPFWEWVHLVGFGE